MHFYAVSRRDIPVHQQAIQSAHAQLALAIRARRQEIDTVPEEDHPFVWLTVANKMELSQLCSILKAFDVNFSVFHDPDYPGYDPSAIAFLLEEGQRFPRGSFMGVF